VAQLERFRARGKLWESRVHACQGNGGNAGAGV
jgi:hypothetical protein